MTDLQRGDQVRVTFGDGDTLVGTVRKITPRELHLAVGARVVQVPRTLSCDLLARAPQAAG